MKLWDVGGPPSHLSTFPIQESNLLQADCTIKKTLFFVQKKCNALNPSPITLFALYPSIGEVYKISEMSNKIKF